MRRARLQAAFVSVCGVVVACGAFSSGDSDGPGTVAGDADVAAAPALDAAESSIDGSAGADGDDDAGSATVSDAGGARTDGGFVGDDHVLRDSAGKPLLVVFITTTAYAGITTAAAADTKCMAEASGRLAGKFVAWFSTATVGAPDRLEGKAGPVDGPWYLVDGARVVKNRAALSQTATSPLEHTITKDPTNDKKTFPVWTATKATGEPGTICPSSPPTLGIPTFVNA